MSKAQNSFYASTVGLAVVIVVMIALAYGWIMNIVTLAHLDSVFSGLGVLRLVGIFVAPLGGVLGYF